MPAMRALPMLAFLQSFWSQSELAEWWQDLSPCRGTSARNPGGQYDEWRQDGCQSTHKQEERAARRQQDAVELEADLALELGVDLGRERLSLRRILDVNLQWLL